MRTMTATMKYALLEGPKICGSYEPEEVLGSFEEGMTAKEYEDAENFLAWIVFKNYTYGHGNLQDRWDEFLSSTSENIVP